MSVHSRRDSTLPAVTALAMVVFVCSVSMNVAAQDQPSPNWEIFGGYSFFYPNATVYGLLPQGIAPVSSALESNPRGVGASVTYDFNRWLGLTADISGHWDSNESGVVGRIDDAAFYNLSVGPKITFRSRHFSPFIEALVGGHRLAPDLFHGDDHFGFMAGGGVDVNLTRHFALRLFRADYVFSNYRFGPGPTVPETQVRGLRAQSGIVFLFGDKEAPAPVSASCTVNPDEVMAGEPVRASLMANNFNSSHTLSYSWTSTGGRTMGNDAAATVDTNGLSGGRYTVTGHVTDARMKKRGEAICTASFSVKEPPRNPPTISCSASPSSLQSGTTSTISCTCASPDNSAVTVGSWTASGGTISGNGSSAALDTSGVAPGSITISAICRDARGLDAQATAQVMVEAPPPVSPEVAQLESRLALHSIYFATARPRAENPDGGLLPSQEQTLVSLAADFQKYLQSKPDAHLILEGHADPRGSVEYNQSLSERRVDRTKSFLIGHGVPEASIQTKAFGEQKNLTDSQVREAVEQNPELSSEQKHQVLTNMETIILASNRRVDITLSTTGQQSVRQYPFNAADSLTLLRKEGTKSTTGHGGERRKKATPQP